MRLARQCALSFVLLWCLGLGSALAEETVFKPRWLGDFYLSVAEDWRAFSESRSSGYYSGIHPSHGPSEAQLEAHSEEALMALFYRRYELDLFGADAAQIARWRDREEGPALSDSQQAQLERLHRSMAEVLDVASQRDAAER